MTPDDIIRMAAEVWNSGSFFPIPSSDDIERFAALVAAEEREACARKVQDLVDQRIPASEYPDLIRKGGA